MSEPDHPARLTAAHWLLLILLASVQLTHVLDFVLIMPLQTHLENAFRIDNRQFGLVVSVYGLGAAVSGLLLARWLDRFDRKRTLLVLYSGFTVGTLLCAVAGNYESLLVARALAGACGGVVAAVVLAIIGDAFPVERRGTATGVVMSAFSVASIVGVPLGLVLANDANYGWRAPFAILGGVSGLLLAFAWWAMPPIRGHLRSRHGEMGLWEVMSRPAHLRAYAFMLAITMSSFVVVPFLIAFLEKNVGRPRGDLPWVYVIGGALTLVTMNVVGRFSDRVSKRWLYRWLGLSVVLPFLWMTNLPPGASLGWVLAATTTLFVLSSARMVPAMALLTSCAAPRYRGRFLSVNSSVQQLGLGLAPLLAGALMGRSAEGEALTGYPLAGLAGAGFAVLSVVLVSWVRPAAKEEAVAVPTAELAVAAEA